MTELIKEGETYPNGSGSLTVLKYEKAIRILVKHNDEHGHEMWTQADRIRKGVEFYSGNYTDLYIPDNSIIYCDIPYKDTKQYSTSKCFDHDVFWQWVREMSDKGHKVFVSEYSAPDDFECVWEKQAKSSLSANGVSGGSKASTEKLFTLNK